MEQMIRNQIVFRGIRNTRVIEAMRNVPRHLFVPENKREFAYDDKPLPIGEGQTISQPYMVAFMTEALDLSPKDRVLEIGTGSGYQTAILSEMAREVYSMEIHDRLGEAARERLKRMDYKNIYIKIGDGYNGWPEKAPFQAVMVTCAPKEIPRPLINQVSDGGKMVVPVGEEQGIQKLILLRKDKGFLIKKEVMNVLFVPMVKGK
jgi:protein-L-isoaspartate(D-aspartate) O-methyltransferase